MQVMNLVLDLLKHLCSSYYVQIPLGDINGHNSEKLHGDFFHFTCEQRGSNVLSGLLTILQLVNVSELGSPIRLAYSQGHVLPPTTLMGWKVSDVRTVVNITES